MKKGGEEKIERMCPSKGDNTSTFLPSLFERHKLREEEGGSDLTWEKGERKNQSPISRGGEKNMLVSTILGVSSRSCQLHHLEINTKWGGKRKGGGKGRKVSTSIHHDLLRSRP